MRERDKNARLIHLSFLCKYLIEIKLLFALKAIHSDAALSL